VTEFDCCRTLTVSDHETVKGTISAPNSNNTDATNERPSPGVFRRFRFRTHHQLCSNSIHRSTPTRNTGSFTTGRLKHPGHVCDPS